MCTQIITFALQQAISPGAVATEMITQLYGQPRTKEGVDEACKSLGFTVSYTSILCVDENR